MSACLTSRLSLAMTTQGDSSSCSLVSVYFLSISKHSRSTCTQGQGGSSLLQFCNGQGRSDFNFKARISVSGVHGCMITGPPPQKKSNQCNFLTSLYIIIVVVISIVPYLTDKGAHTVLCFCFSILLTVSLLVLSVQHTNN